MRRVRRKIVKGQRLAIADRQEKLALDDGTMTTPASVAMIQALIPMGLKAVEDALRAEVTALAGARYARDDAHPGVVRWGQQRGSIYLADQKVAITVPRVRARSPRGRRATTGDVPAAADAPRPGCGAVPPGPGWDLVSGVRGGGGSGAGSVRARALECVAAVHSRECARVAAPLGTPAGRCRVVGADPRWQDVRW